MSRKGDWIQTFTGRQFWPMDPRAEEIDIRDIAHSLAMQCRFTGHCTEFYSVAEHSVRVSQTRICSGHPDLALWGLLHDASEAYLTDLARPVKRSSEMWFHYQKMEAGLMAVVCERFGLQLNMPADVHIADDILLMTEKRDLMGVHPHLPAWVESREPLTERIVPLCWQDAEKAFLDAYLAITGLAK